MREGRPRPRIAESVESQLALIGTLSRATLVERWTAAYGRPPPKGISRRLLEYAAAYHLQVRAYGGLKPAIKRELQRLGNLLKGPARPKPPPNGKTLDAGSRLLREWHGRTYTVDVLDSGFMWDGRRYGSLSEIARSITGARWSGPKFFGL